MIVGRSEDFTSSDPALNPPIVEGQANPIRRDTVQIPSNHSATLRIVADNPGVWLFHCTSSLNFCERDFFLQISFSFCFTTRPY